MLFDAACVACGSHPGPVCEACARLLVPAGRIPGADDGAAVGDGVDVTRAAFVLDERARTIIAALKYRKQRRLAVWLADSMVEHVPRGADAIAWVPATPERRRQRGFDQARELARALSRLSGVPLVAALDRHHDDVRQTGQSRRQRQAGPAVFARGVSPTFVVLIDDVLTTGSSVRVAAHELRRSGASRVVAVVAAATPLSHDSRDASLHRSEIASSIRGWT